MSGIPKQFGMLRFNNNCNNSHQTTERGSKARRSNRHRCAFVFLDPCGLLRHAPVLACLLPTLYDDDGGVERKPNPVWKQREETTQTSSSSLFLWFAYEYLFPWKFYLPVSLCFLWYRSNHVIVSGLRFRWSEFPFIRTSRVSA